MTKRITFQMLGKLYIIKRVKFMEENMYGYDCYVGGITMNFLCLEDFRGIFLQQLHYAWKQETDKTHEKYKEFTAAIETVKQFAKEEAVFLEGRG